MGKRLISSISVLINTAKNFPIPGIVSKSRVLGSLLNNFNINLSLSDINVLKLSRNISIWSNNVRSVDGNSLTSLDNQILYIASGTSFFCGGLCLFNISNITPSHRRCLPFFMIPFFLHILQLIAKFI